MGLFKKEENIKSSTSKNIRSDAKTPSKTSNITNYSYSKGLSESFISKELTISGEITGNSNLRIKGIVEGKITLNADVVIDRESEIKADIKGKNIEISGIVDGNLVADDKITLKETAVVTGNITCKSFTVKEGASFEGNINMIHSAKEKKVNKVESQQKNKP